MFIEKSITTEWIEINGILTSRVSLAPFTNNKDQYQVCFIDKDTSKVKYYIPFSNINLFLYVLLLFEL